MKNIKINIASTPTGNSAIREIMDRMKASIILPSGLVGGKMDFIEFHEERYKVNMNCGSYYAAQYHMAMLIRMKSNSIIKKYCE